MVSPNIAPPSAEPRAPLSPDGSHQERGRSEAGEAPHSKEARSPKNRNSKQNWTAEGYDVYELAERVTGREAGRPVFIIVTNSRNR